MKVATLNSGVVQLNCNIIIQEQFSLLGTSQEVALGGIQWCNQVFKGFCSSSRRKLQLQSKSKALGKLLPLYKS